MRNVLVIGGTKYLGLEFIKMLDRGKINLFVASRKKIEVNNFIEIDRKSQEDLVQVFLDNQFDVVIDFINYSGLDSKKLLYSISKQIQTPRLILISTVYTYDLPTDINCDSIYKEDSFNPLEHDNSILDRPEVTYTEGKRDMESYCLKNYPNDKLVILRFPIILGANDYTNRTQFYYNKIKDGIRINPVNINSKTCYVFAIEAAKAIYNFASNEMHGIYNISHEAISELNLIKLYCNFFNVKVESLIDSSIESSDTPFSSNYDFIVDSNKYSNIFPRKNTFRDALNRELAQISKK